MSVTTPTPSTRPAGRLGSRKQRRRVSPWLAVPLCLALAGGGYATWQFTHRSAATATTTTVKVSQGTISATVSGSGTVAATTSRSLAFPVSGTVSELLVQVGDTVATGQPLARLDTATLQLAVQQAEANLKSAEAQVAAANGQGATSDDIAAAQSKLAAAQASYAQTVNGTTTAAQLASAKAQLASAQAQVNTLLAGPTAADVATAQAKVDTAQRTLVSQQASLSIAKTKAESQVTTAANALRDAQDSYSTLYWQNRQMEKAPGGLAQSAKDQEAAAQRAVSDAEETLKQAQLAYEQAQQAEAVGVQQAQADLKSAEQDLQTLQNGATDAEVAAARATVASAQANLAALQQPATAEAKQIAQASVDQARIALEQLTSPASASTVASAEASLAQAQVALTEAQQNLQHATLTAPFAGVVSAVNLAVGDTASSSGTITVIDPNTLEVTLSLSESDVASVQVGQQVALSFDALPDAKLTGTVEWIAPAATVTSNVATYPVRVSFDPGNEPIKVGMSASGSITTAQHADVIVVPTRAVATQNGVSTVQVQRGPGHPAVPVKVTTGLSSDGQTELLGCVDTSSQCLQAGDTLVVAASTTTTSSSTSTNRNQGGFGSFGGPAGGPPPGR
jgi:HlyD family secretion protein